MVKGGMPSEVLGLELQRDDVDLRFYNPETGRMVSLVIDPDQRRRLLTLQP